MSSSSARIGLTVAILAFLPELSAETVTDDAALAGACAGCHQSSEQTALPELTTLDARTLLQRLRDYRSGALEGTLMNRIAAGYSDAELQRIAIQLARPASGKDNADGR